jgi:regulator of protease activity HflC (stomatin/prohibitin superfamily)
VNVPLGEAWVIERFGKFSRTITEGKFYTVWLIKRTLCRCSHFPRSLEDGGKNIYAD